MLSVRFREDSAIEAGVDEVGRGCLWGPLVAAAVCWPQEAEWTKDIRELSAEIKDSKKLSEKKRKRIAEKIREYATAVGIGVVEAEEIDANGMSLSNQTAFARAVDSLQGKAPDRLLVDGILPLPISMWKKEQHTIVEGDAKYLTIAAASIVAKEYRDTFVKTWCESNKEIGERYGLLSSKGYGTAKHRTAIVENGIHPMHRRLFLRKILGEHIYTRPVIAKVDANVEVESKQKQQCQIQNDSDIEE